MSDAAESWHFTGACSKSLHDIRDLNRSLSAAVGAVDCGSGMGMFQVKVKVSNPAEPQKQFEEMFWVNTGALYTFVPEDRLNSIDLKKLRSRDLVRADGSRQTCSLGEAQLSVSGLDEILTCPVVFAPRGSLYLLGATALEIFAVEADPTERRLKPISAIIGGYRAFRNK